MTVDKTPVEIAPGCGNRGGVDNGVAAGQGVRWERCEKCSGPRDAANTRGPDSIRYERKGATPMVAKFIPQDSQSAVQP